MLQFRSSDFEKFLFFILFFISISLFVWGGITSLLWIFIIQPLATFEAFNTINHLNNHVATFLQHGGIIVGKPLYFFSIYPFIYLNGTSTIYPPFLPVWVEQHPPIWLQEPISSMLWNMQTYYDFLAWFLTFACYGAFLLLSLYLTKIVLDISWKKCGTYFYVIDSYTLSWLRDCINLFLFENQLRSKSIFLLVF